MISSSLPESNLATLDKTPNSCVCFCCCCQQTAISLRANLHEFVLQFFDIFRPSIAMLSIEDFPEYSVPGAKQVGFNPYESNGG